MYIYNGEELSNVEYWMLSSTMFFFGSMYKFFIFLQPSLSSIPLSMIAHPFQSFYGVGSSSSGSISVVSSTQLKSSYINEIRNLKNFSNSIKEIGIKKLYKSFSLGEAGRLSMVYTLYKTLSVEFNTPQLNDINSKLLAGLQLYLYGGLSAISVRSMGYYSMKKEIQLAQPQMSWLRYATQPQYSIYYPLLFGTYDFTKILLNYQDFDTTQENSIRFCLASFSSISSQLLTQPFINAQEYLNNYNMAIKTPTPTNNILLNNNTNNNKLNNFKSIIEYFKNTINNKGIKSLFTPQSLYSTRSNIIKTPTHALFLYISDPFFFFQSRSK